MTTFFCASCQQTVELPHDHEDAKLREAGMRPVAFMLVSEQECTILLAALPHRIEDEEMWEAQGWEERVSALKDLQRKLEDVRLWYSTTSGEIQTEERDAGS